MSTRVCACLLSCLKTICIRRFKGRPDGLDAAKDLLKHGKVLNKAKIYTCDPSKKISYEVKVESFKVVGSSKNCKIEWILWKLWMYLFVSDRTWILCYKIFPMKSVILLKHPCKFARQSWFCYILWFRTTTPYNHIQNRVEYIVLDFLYRSPYPKKAHPNRPHTTE